MAPRKRKTANNKKLTVKQRRLRKLIYKYIFLVIVVATIIGSIVYLLHLPNTRIQTVDVEGTVKIDPEQLAQDVHLFLSEPSLIFPNDSFFFYSHAALEEYIYNRYPRILDLDIDTKNFQHMYIHLSEREGVYQSHVGNTYYEIDSTGKVIDTKKNLEQDTKTIFVNTEHYNLELGGYFITEKQFKKLANFLHSLDNLGVNTKEIKLNNSIEYILKLHDGEIIVINPQDEYTVILEVLREILNYEEFGFDFTEGVFGQSVDYINLRYGNKILYCYDTDPCRGNYGFK